MTAFSNCFYYLIRRSVGAPVDTTKEVSVCWVKYPISWFLGRYPLLTVITDSGREPSRIEKL